MADLTLAVAGHAPNSRRNVDSLLSDWLQLGAPDVEGYYPRLDRYKNVTIYALLTEGTVPPGLKHALDILPFIDGARFEIFTDARKGDIAKWDADEIHVVQDPYEAFVVALSEARSPRLLINWLDTDADDEKVIKLAHDTGKIRVLDLVEGLVEIAPDPPEAPEPEVPVDEPPVKRRRREPIEEPKEELDDTPEPAPSPPVVAVTETPAEPVQTTIPVEEHYTITRELAEQLYVALITAADYHNFGDQQAAILAGKALETAERSPLTHELTNVAELLRAILYGEVPYAMTGSSVSPRQKTGAKPVKVIWDEESKEWRKAGRGRTRAGTRVGMMDESGTVVEAA